MITQTEIAALIPEDFSPNSKVWVYQSSRPFVEKEVREIQEQLTQFYSQWNAHGTPVKGWAQLLFDRFIVLIADETDVLVSGCSIDSSVRVIKSIERQYEVTLFDRLSITFLVKDKAEVLPINQVQFAIDKGYINAETLIFNNIVTTKQQLLDNWLQPLKDSWLAQRLNIKL